MQLALVDLTGSPKGAWMRNVQNSTDLWQRKILSHLDEAQVALDEKDSLHVLIYYSTPLDEVAHYLNKGLTPEQAALAWQNAAEALLSFTYRFSERTVLVCGDITLDELDSVADAIERRVGVHLAINKFDAELDEHPAIETPGAGMKMAALHILGLRRPAELMRHLDKYTISTGEALYIPGLISEFLEDVAAQKRDQTEFRSRIASADSRLERLNKLSNENASLITQLHKTQEELERTLQRVASSNAKLGKLRRGRNARRQTIAKQKRELNRQASKVRWLRSIREHHRQTSRDLRNKLRQTEKELRKLESIAEEVRAMKRSRSWRYTKVLRKINGTEQ